jgi:hypothetical protein
VIQRMRFVAGFTFGNDALDIDLAEHR